MQTKIAQTLTGGIVATLIMTMVMFIGPFMGLPKMNPAAMLSTMMGIPAFMGWALHFMIGIIFALAYVFLFLSLLSNVNSWFLKGIIFGLSVFVFALIMMTVMSALFGGMPSPEGSMILVITGAIMGHMIYGIVVALFVRNVKLHE
jgi:Family of unknown function (DUF6789)